MRRVLSNENNKYRRICKDQEAILKQVNEGAKIAITDGQVSAVLVPSDEYVKLHTTGGSAET